MKTKLHITLFSEEGLAKTIVISKACFKRILRGSALLLIILCCLGFAGIKLFLNDWQSTTTVTRLVGDLTQSHAANSVLHEEVSTLDREKKELLEDTVRKLDEKNKILDSILNAAGVRMKALEGNKNRGGRFIRQSAFQSLSTQSLSAEDVLAKVENYIQTVQTIPLGAPVAGEISSGFGRREDPLNDSPAFHEGVDIRGSIGTKLKATADGRVKDRGYHGTYGWFVEIDHGNGFVTMYCHLKKIMVQNNEKVKRGTIIGLLGNSGRTTGSHVHYEIHHKGHPVNPKSFMSVAATSAGPTG
ncbi:MAG: hypothetical protein A2511_09230 [Deltaproteobacteria bacterium RIFOXYD12_FULL_50_9]|nr:MAG: hypothetical protein A2511_09230 [Deltaproteobacteria bacterium RIFOXYD12_FULL_50_9]